MRSSVATLVVTCLTFGYVIGAGPLCLKCQDAASIEECRQQSRAPCGENENCFLRKYTTDNLDIRFEAGCLSKTTCALLNSLTTLGRRSVWGLDLVRPKKDVTNCFQCCGASATDSGPCNSHLCGQVPNTELVTCKVCVGVHDHIASCSREDVCPPTEACYTGIRVVGTEAKYVFGCANKRICRSLAMDSKMKRVIHGDVGLNICDACCVGRNCNEAECFALKKVMKLSDYLSNITSTQQAVV
uniref:Uncharacterized protein n=1 Tax=Magallana gigas TaxID=29159 RepID=A0A8W8IVT0_MAGGI|nr:uncharacterized protein LOC105329598 [Crassostrea gigas]XP_019923338.2 uncharacterized protein LOC105329598 [Crassostrea gigas]XP_019923340.2 uncharacterized protein LOC105329598 [Crassostrea gigas]